jgi:hypothetical protein
MTQWCETCDRAVEGTTCAVCGNELVEAPREPLPWKWRFFIVASAVYLLYRLYQLITWVVH